MLDDLITCKDPSVNSQRRLPGAGGLCPAKGRQDMERKSQGEP